MSIGIGWRRELSSSGVSIGISGYLQSQPDELTYHPWQTIWLVKNFCMGATWMLMIIDLLITSQIEMKKSFKQKRMNIYLEFFFFSVVIKTSRYVDKTCGSIWLSISYILAAMVLPIFCFIFIVSILPQHFHEEHEHFGIDRDKFFRWNN